MIQPKAPKAVETVVLLTGATSGIGEAFARQLAAQCLANPAKPAIGLAITGRNVQKLQELSDELSAVSKLDCLPIVADLANPHVPAALVQAVVDRWGRLDVLVNNAGYGLPHLFHNTAADELQKQIQVDLTAPILLTRKALPYLLESPAGRVIQVSSSISTIAYPIFGAYGACKAGLSYFTDALRRELSGTNVAVSLIEPGPIRTQFLNRAMSGLEPGDHERSFVESWPQAIFGTPDQVATAMLACLKKPRRRVSVLKRAVWPMRLGGFIFKLIPPLGDFFVSRGLRKFGILPGITKTLRTDTIIGNET
jgi:short-subunit dehydrogenase